jgi:hypothetical protein
MAPENSFWPKTLAPWHSVKQPSACRPPATHQRGRPLAFMASRSNPSGRAPSCHEARAGRRGDENQRFFQSPSSPWAARQPTPGWLACSSRPSLFRCRGLPFEPTMASHLCRQGLRNAVSMLRPVAAWLEAFAAPSRQFSCKPEGQARPASLVPATPSRRKRGVTNLNAPSV